MWLKKIWETDLDKKYSQENAILKDFICKSVGQKTSTLKSFIIDCNVSLIPDEIFEPFVQISNDVTMNSDVYLKPLDRI